ncbi:MAG: hypothetical protein ACYS76_04180 [Planctomycetota bacterium]|jgi:hypothetical protein
MKPKSILIAAVVVGVAAVFNSGCSSQKQQTPAQRPSAEPHEVWQFATVAAAVEAIDYQKREVTLRGPRGNMITFTVDERVERLNEIKVGDKVTADYYVSLATEIREPTAEEKDAPLTIIEGAGKTLPGAPPAAGGLRQIRAVVTVVGIDSTSQMVTVRGPLGRYITIRVAEPARLRGLRLDDTVVVTYTEAVAVSVEKTK